MSENITFAEYIYLQKLWKKGERSQVEGTPCSEKPMQWHHDINLVWTIAIVSVTVIIVGMTTYLKTFKIFREPQLQMQEVRRMELKSIWLSGEHVRIRLDENIRYVRSIGWTYVRDQKKTDYKRWNMFETFSVFKNKRFLKIFRNPCSVQSCFHNFCNSM